MLLNPSATRELVVGCVVLASVIGDERRVVTLADLVEVANTGVVAANTVDAVVDVVLVITIVISSLVDNKSATVVISGADRGIVSAAMGAVKSAVGVLVCATLSTQA